MRLKDLTLCAAALAGILLLHPATSGDCRAQAPVSETSDGNAADAEAANTPPQEGIEEWIIQEWPEDKPTQEESATPPAEQSADTSAQRADNAAQEPEHSAGATEASAWQTQNSQPRQAAPQTRSMSAAGQEKADTAALDRPLTRKEERKEKKRLKNMPLDLPELRRDPFRVSGGRRIDIRPDSAQTHIADSLAFERDSMALAAGPGANATDSLGNIIHRPATPYETDSTLLAAGADARGDMLADGEIAADSVSYTRREIRAMRKAEFRADSMYYRHHPLLRDTLKLGRVAMISAVAPGFGQFYNQDYWKIPVLYGAVGASVFLGVKQHQKYKSLKGIYDDLYYRLSIPGENGSDDGRFNRELLDPVQRPMIKHNTWRQLFFGAAIGTYIYFIGDGVVNYPAPNTQVKIATTLSMVCPGAGQFYNKSYWRVPIVMGGFAALVYVIDWNNRYYKRFDAAYQLVYAREQAPEGEKDKIARDEFGGAYDSSRLKNYKDSARRDRDLAIILTAAFYILNVIDAHTDAQLKDYDVSDDLSWDIRLQPSIQTTNTQSYGTTNSFGLSLSLVF